MEFLPVDGCLSLEGFVYEHLEPDPRTCRRPSIRYRRSCMHACIIDVSLNNALSHVRSIGNPRTILTHTTPTRNTHTTEYDFRRLAPEDVEGCDAMFQRLFPGFSRKCVARWCRLSGRLFLRACPCPCPCPSQTYTYWIVVLTRAQERDARRHRGRARGGGAGGRVERHLLHHAAREGREGACGSCLLIFVVGSWRVGRNPRHPAQLLTR